MRQPNPNPWKIAALATLTAAVWATLFAHPAGAASGGLVPGGSGTTAQTTTEAGRYTRLWQERVTLAERRWAHRTSECESGGDPKALGDGGLYRGAFQFTRNAWKTSPKSPGGDPIAYPYRTQAVVAVMLKRRDGTRPWPVCG
jgi:Transglycosylase-like domain